MSTGVLEAPTKGLRIEWDTDDLVSVQLAETAFAEAKARKDLLVATRGDEAVVIKDFDQTAERIVAAPQLVGG
jgi:hypothetical protein